MTLLLALLCSLSVGSVLLAMWFRQRASQLQRQWQSLAEAAARNQAVVDGSGEGVFELTRQGHIAYANPAALRLLGYEEADIVGSDYRRWLTDPQSQGDRDAARVGSTTDMLRGIGALLRCKGGRLRPVEYRLLSRPSVLHAPQQGTATSRDQALTAPPSHRRAASDNATLLVFRDLTERSRVDVMLADMQHMAQVGAWELKVGSARVNISEGIAQRLHLPTSRRVPLRRLLQVFTSHARVDLFRALRAAIHSGSEFDIEVQMRSHDPLVAPESWWRVMGRTECIDNQVVRLFGTAQDVTARKRADLLLRDTSHFFETTLDALPACILHFNQKHIVDYANRSTLARELGFAQARGNDLATLFAGEQRELATGIRAALNGEARQLLRNFAGDMQRRQIQCNFVPHVDVTARPIGCWLVLSDVTELKMLEARLYQAEKLQAVGQLTGGVAHDFNNLLGVILGNLQLLERDLPSKEAVQKKLATAMRAALRGSELTKRLLSFARRQKMEPQVIDPGAQLRSLGDLLQQTLGDAIEVRFAMAMEPWRVRVDVGQLENAILNLALNARDAMPKGGVLTLQTQNLRPDPYFFLSHPDLLPGDYVQLSVIDTGSGIPARVLNRIFEPFFTTKEVGKGSGLGLAMVHGFAQQSGGTVLVHSEMGQGTQVSLYLPRSAEEAVSITASETDTQLHRGQETILVVEDDTDLRATTVLCLQQLGYRVLDASQGEAALEHLRREAVQVLFTDVVMPAGMMGTDLAIRARQLQPGIRVLLTTGYPDTALPGGTDQLEQEHCLVKPYTNNDLAKKLRELLD